METLLQQSGVDPQKRPQELSIEQWTLLAHNFEKLSPVPTSELLHNDLPFEADEDLD